MDILNKTRLFFFCLFALVEKSVRYA